MTDNQKGKTTNVSDSLSNRSLVVSTILVGSLLVSAGQVGLRGCPHLEEVGLRLVAPPPSTSSSRGPRGQRVPGPLAEDGDVPPAEAEVEQKVREEEVRQCKWRVVISAGRPSLAAHAGM